MLAVLPVQGESLPYRKGCPAYANGKAGVGTGSRDVEDHDQNEDAQQAAGKYEQVLRLEPFELYSPSYALIDVVAFHKVVS